MEALQCFLIPETRCQQQSGIGPLYVSGINLKLPRWPEQKFRRKDSIADSFSAIVGGLVPKVIDPLHLRHFRGQRQVPVSICHTVHQLTGRMSA
jgi:hypothetical protein